MKQNKQPFRLPLRAWLLYLILLAFLSTGVTLSRYVTSTTGDDRAAVIGFQDITITETGDFYAEGKLLMQPGVDLEKKAVVEFGGSEAAVYVFLTVETSTFERLADTEQFAALHQKICWQMDSSWHYLRSDNDQHIYYLLLAPNTALQQDIILDGTVTVSETIKNSQMQGLSGLAVTFQATAVQADGFGDFATEQAHAAAAWDAVSQ